MVMIIIVDMQVLVIMVISGQTGKPGKPGQTGQTGKTDLTFKLDFPGYLCRASFANFTLFYTGYGMD